MGEPAARKGDQIVALDMHIQMLSTPAGPVPTPQPMPFSGAIDEDVSSTVLADGKPLALLGSKASNAPAHIPVLGPFQKQPDDKGKVTGASGTSIADSKRVARIGDTAQTCDDLGAQNNGTIVPAGAASTVLVG